MTLVFDFRLERSCRSLDVSEPSEIPYHQKKTDDSRNIRETKSFISFTKTDEANDFLQICKSFLFQDSQILNSRDDCERTSVKQLKNYTILLLRYFGDAIRCDLSTEKKDCCSQPSLDP